MWHALRVAGGLDSLVVGEGQILAQMKRCYELSTSPVSILKCVSALVVYLDCVPVAVGHVCVVDKAPQAVSFYSEHSRCVCVCVSLSCT